MNQIEQIRDRIKIETRLSHSLLKSSHDFIRSAVNYAKESDENSWKFAVLHLASALELLFKSRLAEEHWSLVFADPDKATVANLQTGDFLSVDIDTSIKRLKNIIDIELSTKDRSLIKKLKEVRNKIIHFHIDINKNTIKVIAAQSLNTYIEFYNNNIAPNWEDYSVFGYELSQTLNEFKEFVNSRMESLSTTLDNSNRPKTNYFWECPECLQDAIIFTEENILRCVFCGDSRDIVEVAELYSENKSVNYCPSCKVKSFIVTSIKNDQKNLECLICGHYIGHPKKWMDINGNILSHLRNFGKS